MRFKIEHLFIGLGLLTAVAFGVVACMDPSTDSSSLANSNSENTQSDTTTDESSTNDTPAVAGCQPILDKGALYRVPVEGGTAPTQLLGDLNLSGWLIIDDGALYFTEHKTEDSTGSIKILATDAPPGTTPEVFVAGLDCPRAISINQGFLYSGDGSENGSIDRVNLETGERMLLVGDINRLLAMAVDSEGDDTWVYFTEQGTQDNNFADGTVKRFRVGSDGSVTGTETLAENLKRPVGLTLDSYYVYVVEIDAGRVFRMSKDFAGVPMPTQEDLMTGLSTPYPPVLEDPTPGDPNDGNSILYFADFNAADPNAGKIYKLAGVDLDTIATVTPEDCGTDTPLSCTLLADSLSWPMVVTVDDINIYWTEIWSASVKGVGKDGSSNEPFELGNGIEHGFKTPFGIATDGVNVYFTDVGDNPCCF